MSYTRLLKIAIEYEELPLNFMISGVMEHPLVGENLRPEIYQYSLMRHRTNLLPMPVLKFIINTIFVSCTR
jgi:hypothetical protein